jgi:SSS family transporter
MDNLVFAGWSGVVILLVYGAIMLGIGYYVYRKNKNIHESMDEYYLGGRSLGLLVLFFTLFATQYSGNTIIGYPATAYRMGYGWLVSIPFMILIIAGYLLFAPRLYSLSKKHKFLTPSDWLQIRFNSKAVTIAGTLLMAYGVCNYLLEQLVAIGQGVAGLTGGTIPYQVAVVFFILVMLIYGWLGGMRSVAYTDLMQGIALLVGVFLLVIGAIVLWGGLPTAADYMATASPEKIGVPTTGTITNWFSLLILISIGAAVYPHAIQRIYAAKSQKILKKSLSRMVWMPFLTTGLVFIVGLIGVKAYPGLEKLESEQIVGMMANAIAAEHIIFYWGMILLFGGIIAAIVSTADSALLTFSSMVSKDIYGNFINPNAPEKKKLLIGKLTGVVVVFLLLIIAWYPPGTLYEIFVLKFEVLVQVAPAFILGLYWKRLSSKPVLIGMIVGALIAGIMTWTGHKTYLGFYSGIWGFLANLAICTIGSFMVTTSVNERQSTEKVFSA